MPIGCGLEMYGLLTRPISKSNKFRPTTVWPLFLSGLSTVALQTWKHKRASHYVCGSSSRRDGSARRGGKRKLEKGESKREGFFKRWVALKTILRIEKDDEEDESDDWGEEVEEFEDEKGDSGTNKTSWERTNCMNQVVPTICSVRGSLVESYISSTEVENREPFTSFCRDYMGTHDVLREAIVSDLED